jgi:hypothetical protein
VSTDYTLLSRRAIRYDGTAPYLFEGLFELSLVRRHMEEQHGGQEITVI